MDLHPTRNPGKQRPAAPANPTKKVDGDRSKPSLQPAQPARPNRVFGTVRNGNITGDKAPSKPLPGKPCRPWKPSGNACTQKAKDGSTKARNVVSHEPARTAGVEDERQRTPTSAGGAAEVGTPYRTAENCSKCRFDKLETSAYWLAQIKIAETVGKHFVSAAFFRLALECCAQPLRSLRSELKHYMARHDSVSSETPWGDLCQAYGLADDQPNSDHCNLGKVDAALVEDVANFETVKDECFEFDIIQNPNFDLSEKENANFVSVDLAAMTDDDVSKEEFVDVKVMPNSKVSPVESKMGRKKSIEGDLSGKSSKSTSRIAAGSKISTRIRAMEDVGKD